MIFDLVVLCVVFFFAILGYREGFMGQISRVAKLIGVLILMVPVSRPIESVIASQVHWPCAVVHIASLIVAAVLVNIVLSIALRRVEKVLTRDEEGSMKPWNRKAGMALGAAKAAVVMFVCLAFLDGLSEAVAPVFPKTYAAYRHSFCGVVVSWYNPFRNWRVVDSILALHDAIRHPEEFSEVRKDERFQALIEYAKFKTLMDDKDFQAAAKRKDYYAILRDKRVGGLIADKEFLKRLAGAVDALREVRDRKESSEEKDAGIAEDKQGASTNDKRSE